MLLAWPGLTTGCGDNIVPIDAPPGDAAPPDAMPDARCPDDADPTTLPDLVILGERTQDSLDVQEQAFQPDHCALLEGCVNGPGMRRLLRFATVTHNRGDRDLHVGPPDEDDPAWEYSPCHGHYHLIGYAVYELLDQNGVVASGHKQAFCLTDSTQVEPDKIGCGYNCSDQGISAGWADVYSHTLDCQWIDTTDLPSGDYTLRLTVNPEQLLVESDYSNNIFETTVTLD